MNSGRRIAFTGVLFLLAVGSLSIMKGSSGGGFSSEQVLYGRSSFLTLALEHILLVGSSSFAAAVTGVALGVFVTRRAGRSFLPVVNMLASVGQTFPPVAVLALAVPLVGFGREPTVIALFCYGIFPIVRNTITGIESVDKDIRDAARGVGMYDREVLFRVELPLAASIIIAGIRTSVIINIGTATIGATIGAGGFGAPIISGLINNNFYFVLQGGICVALLAIFSDQIFEFAVMKFKRV
ncbi:binding-protein-dependent transport systems inner membrane component [Denitrovibrio acetiphilus DSM 12809]|uniref:Binding-protein-dependent transport systems inner membrane component n=1 Tax=Denitrovibrio acetiphilus (strain DSM 12809 / NBRC 114555 / N2460) TaxID=522772 RepID=D4H3U4_DENA2|nr:ABC transporter permease [Denitrovibrio acetiphilus]ADD69196.1 binding-protein-dependent transport systems inner membrane component [Denitrovibrio acetiphilus DSM 12809]